MEIESMYGELYAENGMMRVVYKLMELRDGGERTYAISCWIAGGASERMTPALFSDREVALLVMSKLAARCVMPAHITDLVRERYVCL